MESMKWSKRLQKYLLSPGLKRADILLTLAAVLLLIFCWEFRMPVREALQGKTEISLGYSAKQGPDGRLYVLDSGHGRLLCFDETGKIHFSIENPGDEISELSYIDDFCVTEDGILLSASQWNEMALAREAVLSYDGKGSYRQTLVSRDYTEDRTNKHRFYGIHSAEGVPRYIECLSDSIRIGDREIPYENAFHAVSDAVFVGDTVYILDKDGTVRGFSGGEKDGTVVYSLSREEDEHVVPYRLGADGAGNLYFTDIRNRVVRKIDPEGRTSRVCSSTTDSLTVGITEQGEFLLLDGDGLHVAGDSDVRSFLSLEKSGRTRLLQTVWLLALAVGSVLFLTLALRLILMVFRKKHSMPQIVSFWVIGAVTVVSALLCGMLMNAFAESYRAKIEEQVESAAYMVANQISGEDIDRIEETGGFGGDAYRRLCGIMEKSFPMEIAFYNQLYCNILKLTEDGSTGYAVAYLDQSIGAYFPLDEVEQAELQRVYETGEAVWNQAVADISGTYLSVKVPVFDSAGMVRGAVAVGVETYVITDTLNAMLTKILLSAVAMLMLVWLISVEGMSFANNFELYRRNRAEGAENLLPGHLIRLLVFLVFAAYNLTATFLPVYLLRRVDCFPESMRELAGALPITVNIFLIGVMSLFCAGLVRRHGLKKILAFSALCSLAGNLLIFLRTDFFSICAGLVLDGIGVGLITNAVYVMLTYIKDEVGRTWGLTIYNGAYLSGINFGMIFGSLLAMSLGQRQVFGVVALAWLGMLVLTGVLVRQMEGMLGTGKEVQAEPDSGISLGAFLGSRQVLGFIALIQNPYILFGSFIFYYVPLFCDQMGYSETICSLLIMLYSQVAVLGTDRLTQWVEQKTGKAGLYAALGLNMTALLVFAAWPGMTGMIAALVLMGVSAAFGKPVQQAYYLRMDRVRQYSEDKSMGIYNFSENIGESLGPVVFGRLMAAPGLSPAVGAFCGVIAGCAIAHFLLCGKELNYEVNV